MDSTIRYWLCCGSKDKRHNDERGKTCIEAKSGFPERCRFGTADEHSLWSKKQSTDLQPTKLQDYNLLLDNYDVSAVEDDHMKASAKYGW